MKLEIEPVLRTEQVQVLKAVTAEVIECPGNLGNQVFYALQLNIEDFSSPYVMMLMMPAKAYKELKKDDRQTWHDQGELRAEPKDLMDMIASSVNKSRPKLKMERG